MGVSRNVIYRKKSIKTKNKANESELINQIKKICKDRPFWGYRRITAWLKKRCGVHVNRKKVYRIMRENNLLVKQKRYAARRKPMRSKPRPNKMNEWWGIDMTKFMIEPLGWVYLVVVLDWYTRKIVGFSIGLQSKTPDWLDALDTALNSQCPDGSREHGLHLMSDNGSQPTSKAFIKACKVLKVKQAFTSYNNPKGNANTERVIRTIKEDCIWINEWTTFEEAENAVTKWIDEYNQFYPHSMLDYNSPNECEQTCTKQKAA